MKFTYSISMCDASYYVPLARAAEEAGYDAISIPDSICYPEESDSTYPYTPDGNREFLEAKPFIEPLIAIAAMSAATTRIRFLTSVLKLPIRHPVIFAKEATSLAVLTGERLDLGVGTSPWPDDFEAVGLPWRGRGRRFEECIEIIRALATGAYVEHDGADYRFQSIKLNPVPKSPIPILVGGHAEVNLERAGRMADGWIAAGLPTEEIVRMIGVVNEHRRHHERAHEPFAFHATALESFTADGVKRLEDIGVTHTGGGFSGFNPYAPGPDTEPLDNKIDALRRYADDVIAKVSG